MSCERRFSTGSNIGWTATAENAANHGITIVAVVPYDHHFCAPIGRFRPSVIGGSFYFSRRMI
nr:MAG TPA: hypothetical protein [Caudoviricetes sp.]